MTLFIGVNKGDVYEITCDVCGEHVYCFCPEGKPTECFRCYEIELTKKIADFIDTGHASFVFIGEHGGGIKPPTLTKLRERYRAPSHH